MISHALRQKPLHLRVGHVAEAQGLVLSRHCQSIVFTAPVSGVPMNCLRISSAASEMLATARHASSGSRRPHRSAAAPGGFVIAFHATTFRSFWNNRWPKMADAARTGRARIGRAEQLVVRCPPQQERIAAFVQDDLHPLSRLLDRPTSLPSRRLDASAGSHSARMPLRLAFPPLHPVSKAPREIRRRPCR